MKRLLLPLLLCCTATATLAVKTERWEIKGAADFMRGKLNQVSVTDEGLLRLGYAANDLGEFAQSIWCSLIAPDGTIYFGTGTPADIYAVRSGGGKEQPAKIFQTDAIAVTALALDSHGNLYAATMAEGKIFKIPAGKDKAGAEFCRLRAPYIWALAVDKQDHLFAGTGPDGRIYRINPDGKPEEWYAAEDANILCLAFDTDGSLLAGGSDRGLLYRITEKSTATVLHEFSEDEVKSLVVNGPDLFIGVNKQKVRRPRGPAGQRRPSAAEFEDLTQRLAGQFGARPSAEQAARERETPAESRVANLLSGSVYLRNPAGRIDTIATWDNESVLALASGGEGGVFAAMAGAGRVYRVSSDQHWEMLFDLDQPQALTVSTRDGKLCFIGTGNVGKGYVVDAQRATRGDFLSQVRDSRFLTSWGNLLWAGEGAIAVATRSGNTAFPDSTWSDWSAPLSAPPGKIASPRGRFIQVRAQLSGDKAVSLETIALYYQMQNQKPEVTSLTVGEETKSQPEKPKADLAAHAKGESSDSDESEAKASKQASELKAEEFRPKAASTIKSIKWRATDKDGDTLIYRLFYQAEGTEQWIAMSMDKPLKKSDYAWDTDSIPDGWYKIKLVASDEESNPAGEALSDEKISDRIKIDNRRPDVLQLSFDAASNTLKGVARDNLSLIRFLEYSIDGGDWKFFAPSDGLFDDREEAFVVKLPSLAAGAHTIAVRATDEEGNVGAEKIAVTAK